jgi:hypothetical protein
MRGTKSQLTAEPFGGVARFGCNEYKKKER